MDPREFFINPADYGLPTRDELVACRIWHPLAVRRRGARRQKVLWAWCCRVDGDMLYSNNCVDPIGCLNCFCTA